MPRTTIDIDASVLRQLKALKQSENKPLGQLASELLAKALAESPSEVKPEPFRWTSKPLGLKIDLEDKEALWAMLDAETLAGRNVGREAGSGITP